MTPIRSASGVEEVATRARAHGRFALDFEFMWERSYAPLPCLAQVATPDGIDLIDPVDGAPLDPIAELVADPQITAVMHAPAADLTLMQIATGAAPSNLHDVQLMAGFVGLGVGQGLQALLDRVLRVRLDKSERYTDWSKRPLRDAQLAYAAADVEHLLALADNLWDRIDALERRTWVLEEHERRYGADSRWAPEPEASWRRVKGQGRLKPAERARLKELAAWREREAARIDKPTSWVVPDRTLIELARRRPSSSKAVMNERGVPERVKSRQIQEILEALERSDELEPIEMPPPPPPEVQARLEVLGPLGQVVVSARAAEAELAPSLVATRDEIHGFIASRLSENGRDFSLSEGWRFELAGRDLVALAEGRLILAPTIEPPYLNLLDGE
ncbi:MAG: HRDC domain-containing protein [Thermoleophilia bacterium]|nr:HRDC domain-containing protein [Thermoleophilia bacterium]MDH3725240.1 HRDC domain-containing protein [Thermoleophilia bacterium]